MNVGKHLLNDIKPLKPLEKVKDVLDLMEELKFSHLPVVDDERKYLGLICEDDLLEVENEDSPLGQYPRFFRSYAISLTSNLFEAIRIIGKGNLSLLPIVDQEGVYQGYLSPLEVIQDLGRQLTFSESGSVLILELAVRDFQLSQVSQIIESEDAKIIGFNLTSGEDDKLLLNLKINTKDLSRILKTFERYNYRVIDVFHESLFDETLSDRYESLLKYLNM